MHRTLIAVLRLVGVRPVYAVMAVFVVPFYMLFRPKGFSVIRRYMLQRQGFGQWKAFRYACLNHYRFGQVVIDRFALYAGVKFQFDIVNNDLFTQLCQNDDGFIILSSHAGNYEMAGYTFKSNRKAYNALVYGGEAQTVMENRQRLFRKNNIRMISVSDDMSHIFEINNALSDGQIVSIPADRIFGSPRFVECQLLGATARLPLGPYALAAQRGANTISMHVMKVDTYKYKVYIKKIEAEGNVALKRNERPQALAQSFASELEAILKQYPEQWYNYYEFWNTAT
jgi:predicted LPLAT superfamily acyltransferase